MKASISQNTLKMYDVAWQLLLKFTRELEISPVFPPSLKDVINFISYLSLKGYASSTIKSYVSAISFKCKMNNVSDTSNCFIIRKMLTGLGRLDRRKDLRMPITYDLLVKIIHALPNICYSNFESTLFAALFSLAFFGFMRVCELVQESDVKVSHALQSENVKISNTFIEILLAHSKSDQLGKGVVISLPSTSGIICPVRLLQSYDKLKPHHMGSYFRHATGHPVTRYQFTCVLSKALNQAGINSNFYSSHSFRIGAATSAAMMGLEDEQIAKCGRWTSNIFKSYVRIPTNVFK